MGPNILLDKSVLHGLSDDELWTLVKHYRLVLPPVVILEVIGDLAKRGDSPESTAGKVAVLASKLKSMDSAVTMNHTALGAASLFGHRVDMNGFTIARPDGRRVRGANGSSGILFDEDPVWESIRRWENGNFTPTDAEAAREWRDGIARIDLTRSTAPMKELFPEVPELGTCRELGEYFDLLASRTDSVSQYAWVQKTMEYLHLSDEGRNRASARWLESNMPGFQQFAPYAFYCFKVNACFYFALTAGLVTPKRTNLVDLQYLFYLPFCIVFSSRDGFHTDMCRVLLTDKQDFVHGDSLKGDLRRLRDEWNGLSEAEKEQRSYDYGSHPPPNEDSVTYMMWKKHMKPWKPGSGNRAGRMTEEEQADLMEKLKPMLDAFREANGEAK